mmetsp:Transcript_107700/g.304475  ORF Transcript_107700/g.304475 Transcript_107700/m.304475 type:complete len:422 (-) Transcript_107700:7-1272(-)
MLLTTLVAPTGQLSDKPETSWMRAKDGRENTAMISGVAAATPGSGAQSPPRRLGRRRAGSDDDVPRPLAVGAVVLLHLVGLHAGLLVSEHLLPERAVDERLQLLVQRVRLPGGLVLDRLDLLRGGGAPLRGDLLLVPVDLLRHPRGPPLPLLALRVGVLDAVGHLLLRRVVGVLLVVHRRHPVLLAGRRVLAHLRHLPRGALHAVGRLRGLRDVPGLPVRPPERHPVVVARGVLRAPRRLLHPLPHRRVVRGPDGEPHVPAPLLDPVHVRALHPEPARRHGGRRGDRAALAFPGHAPELLGEVGRPGAPVVRLALPPPDLLAPARRLGPRACHAPPRPLPGHRALGADHRFHGHRRRPLHGHRQGLALLVRPPLRGGTAKRGQGKKGRCGNPSCHHCHSPSSLVGVSSCARAGRLTPEPMP